MALLACRRFNDPIDDATRRHWEQMADRCFDRAYLAVLRQVTPKPANGQVPGPRVKDPVGRSMACPLPDHR